MLKSKCKKLSTATAEQADMVDLKRCKKVMKIDDNGSSTETEIESPLIRDADWSIQIFS